MGIIDVTEVKDWLKYKKDKEEKSLRRILDAKQRKGENARNFMGRLRNHAAEALKNETKGWNLTAAQFANERDRMERLIRRSFISGLKNPLHVVLAMSLKDKTLDDMVAGLQNLEYMKRGNEDDEMDQPRGVMVVPARGKVKITELKEEEPRGQLQHYQQPQAPIYTQQVCTQQKNFQQQSFAPQGRNSRGAHGGGPLYCAFCDMAGHTMVNCFLKRDMIKFLRQSRKKERFQTQYQQPNYNHPQAPQQYQQYQQPQEYQQYQQPQQGQHYSYG